MACVVWFTGLPGAGKTTIAKALAADMIRRGFTVLVLDGDELRREEASDLGFSKDDRDEHVARVARRALDEVCDGTTVLVALVSPFEEARQKARHVIAKRARFIEVHVATPLAECIRRDPKGLYAQALAGEVPDFTGVTSPYEEPLRPEVRLDTTVIDPACAARLVLQTVNQIIGWSTATGLPPLVTRHASPENV